MNQLPAFLANSTLEFVVFPQSQAFENKSYAAYSESSGPWDGAALVLNSIGSKQKEDAHIAQAVEDAILAERNRLARELHDAVTQTLFAASSLPRSCQTYGIWMKQRHAIPLKNSAN